MGGGAAATQQKEQTLGEALPDPTDLFQVAFSRVQMPGKSPAKTRQSPTKTQLEELAEEGMELLEEEGTLSEEEEPETPPPFREESAVGTIDINQVSTILSNLATKHPYTNPKPESLFTQSSEDRTAAATLFTPGGDPAKYKRVPVTIARSKGFPNTLEGQAMTKEQATWLEEQGTRVPLDAVASAYRECEQGTWMALGTTLFTAPTIAEFNTSTNRKAAQKLYTAESTWAVDDRVVWYTENHSSHDRHEANTFKLGRILGTPTNSQPIIVDLTPTSSQEKCVTTVSKWQGERADTDAFSKSPGTTKLLRTYNILPVTSALQMQVYPYWRLHNVNRNNPKELHTNPFFCKLNWDPQEVVRPENFAEGRYYFWLNPQDFQMGAWLCRGIANVPDEIARSQAFTHLQEYLIPLVIDAFPAQHGQPPPDGTTRVVWREFMAHYIDRAWRSELVIASKADSIDYYMLESQSNTHPIQLVGVSRKHPNPFGSWGYVFRQYIVSKPLTKRTRFSQYDEAVAIIRNLPLPSGALINQAKRQPLYWATHRRPGNVNLPSDPILERHLNKTEALLPLEASQYVVNTLKTQPHAFSEPRRPWYTKEGKRTDTKEGKRTETAEGEDTQILEGEDLPLGTRGKSTRSQVKVKFPPKFVDTTPPSKGGTGLSGRKPKQPSPGTLTPSTPSFADHLEAAQAAGEMLSGGLSRAIYALLSQLPPGSPDPATCSLRGLQGSLLRIADSQQAPSSEPTPAADLPA